ncbi:MAG: fold metallo-hydrolase [Acidimicrobiales bacterium]|nr:fold metallo-hydrolase [Acidimicrobiales bacterium]
MNVTFWGVRGSTPCPCEENLRYGGNTACVSIDAPGLDPIVLDLGTGLRFWGQQLPTDGSFHGLALVTHLHWDHVQGLPFFSPINAPGASLDVHAPRQRGQSVADMFDDFMRPPYFPVRATDLFGDIRFHDSSDTELTWGRARVLVRDVPHVGETNGYRIELDGLVIAYISDHQQPVGSDGIADSVIELCRDADLLIHDAQYDPDEFAVKSNWGHCTVDYAVQVAAAAGVRRLALFHHDPSHADHDVDRLLAGARQTSVRVGGPEVIAAAEGTTIALTVPSASSTLTPG